MIGIAITPEILSDERKEASAVSILLAAGWDRVHLRHPLASRREMQRLIEAIPQEFHGRLSLHGHFDLTNYFNLGGLHLNSRCPSAPALYRGLLSRSCHSVKELLACGGLAYATLSPIFDSISKRGYLSRFPERTFRLPEGVTVPVVALGGVTPERIADVRRCGFSGFAMLGAVPWDAGAGELKRFADHVAGLK